MWIVMNNRNISLVYCPELNAKVSHNTIFIEVFNKLCVYLLQCSKHMKKLHHCMVPWIEATHDTGANDLVLNTNGSPDNCLILERNLVISIHNSSTNVLRSPVWLNNVCFSDKRPEQSIAAARASVMVYDDINKKWVPAGSSHGLSKVQIQ